MEFHLEIRKDAAGPILVLIDEAIEPCQAMLTDQ
jgi:hypothetical protein